MFTEVLILFLVGIFLAFASYWTRDKKGWSLAFKIAAILCIAIPVLFFFYVAYIIFTA